MKRPKILLAAEDDYFRSYIQAQLPQDEFEIVFSSKQSIKDPDLLENHAQLIMLASNKKRIGDILDAACHIRSINPAVPVILIVTHSSEPQVLAALRAGVNDYFCAPFPGYELLDSVRKHLRRSAKISLINVKTAIKKPEEKHRMIGHSGLMREIKTYLQKLATTDSTVLITGDTGTGKEVAASFIHRRSHRRANDLVCVNCAALPENLVESELFGYERGAFTGAGEAKPGKFELAQGGTLFLDEIGDMGMHAQAKILRTIEQKECFRLGGNEAIPIDVRIIAATNQDLERSTLEGRFRQDLYFRLNVAQVRLPPLRDRKEDIPYLLDHFIQKLNVKFNQNIGCITKEAHQALFEYNWVGNIRELKNILEAAFIDLPYQSTECLDLPRQFYQKLDESKSMAETERDKLLAALFQTNWNKSKAAQKLSWSRMTLYRKMAKYGIVEALKEKAPAHEKSVTTFVTL